ncbi:MAG: Putative phosphoesterase, partial [uncultured Acidimicrobiales bacterium]
DARRGPGGHPHPAFGHPEAARRGLRPPRAGRCNPPRRRHPGGRGPRRAGRLRSGACRPRQQRRRARRGPSGDAAPGPRRGAGRHDPRQRTGHGQGGADAPALPGCGCRRFRAQPHPVGRCGRGRPASLQPRVSDREADAAEPHVGNARPRQRPGGLPHPRSRM